MEQKNRIVGNYYYCSDGEIGALHREGKGKRPYYILCGADNEYYFGVVSTTIEHKGRKKTFQDKKYIENDMGSYLRLDASIGFRFFKKEDLKEGVYDKKIGNLSNEKREKLLKFYEYDINQKRRHHNEERNKKNK